MENAQPEPSMEEILASIRRIISEDEEESGETAKTPSHPVATKPEAADAEAPEPALSPIETPSQEPQGQGDEGAETPVADSSEAEPAAAAPLDIPSQEEGLEMFKKNAEAAVSESAETLILDQTAAAAASQAFESLSQSVRVAGDSSRTVEDIVVAMLQPMIKEWLDANLPAIVEEKVEEEVKRVARRRG